jgi:predicted dehydrogenase
MPHRTKDAAALECIEAGLHVFVEKPLAVRVGTARALIEAADRRGVHLAVGHQYRTFRTPQTIKRTLASGRLGPVMEVLWTWHQFRTDRYFDQKPWIGALAESGGGALVLQLAHDLDLLVWLLGPPARVSALLSDSLHGRDGEDAVSAIIEFTQGATVTFQASINRPQSHVIRHIIGERAMLVVPSVAGLVSDEPEDLVLGIFEPPLPQALGKLEGSHAQPEVRWKRVRTKRPLGAEPGWKRPRRLWRRLDAYQNRPGPAAVLDSFFREIRGGEESLATGRSALPSVELRNAMVLSSVEGRRVELPLDAAEIDRLYDLIEQDGLFS